MSVDEMAASVRGTLGPTDGKFWLVFSHVHGDEAEKILTGLEGTHEVLSKETELESTIYLLQRR